MIEARTEQRGSHSQELVRQKAVNKLGAYLRTSQETNLRAHQISVMHSCHQFFQDGGTAGYISLPTGFGKTVVATELIQALDMKTVILSPTRLILEQTRKIAHHFTPDLKMTNYYSEEKKLTGQILNTTYQSFFSLLEEGKINPDEIELVICDEAHKALGEKRHTLFRKLPQALMIGLTATPFFTPLEGYKGRGLVEENESWVGLFHNMIHEMSLEEAIERGILVNVDVYLLKTNTRADSITLTQKGEYNQTVLDRVLNTDARNALTIGLLAGVEKISQTVVLSEEQKGEMQQLHAKIVGKRTAVFGLTIKQIENLAQSLRLNGVSAETIHEQTNKSARRQILTNYQKGETQVILGVQVLAEGWDSPQTEVGIFLAPTRSGIKAKQSFGRILRPCEEIGKNRALAIQLVDEFPQRQGPILIPHLFHSYYVLRGTQTGRPPGKSHHRETNEQPIITFSGMDPQLVLEKTPIEGLLQARFKHADIAETNAILDRLVSHMQTVFSDLGPLEFYQKIAESLPYFVDFAKQHQALQAIASLDSNTSAAGQKALIFLNLKTILAGVKLYLSEDKEENNEIIQAAITHVWESFDHLAKQNASMIAQRIYYEAVNGAAKYIAQKEGTPVKWVEDKIYTVIHLAVKEAMDELPTGLNSEIIEGLSKRLSAETGIKESSIKRHLIFCNLFIDSSERIRVESDALSKTLKQISDKELIEQMLSSVSLTGRQRKIIELYYGLSGDKAMTLSEIGKYFGVSGGAMSQDLKHAFQRIRRWLTDHKDTGIS